MSTVHYTDTPMGAGSFRRISWGAIFAGAFVALAAQVLFALLGMSIGLAAVNPADPSGIGAGAGIWWTISSLVALFIGGWVGGRLAGVADRTDGMLHGLVVWSAATVLSIYFVTTTIGSVVSGALGAVGQTLEYAGQAVSQAAPEATSAAKQVFNEAGTDQGASIQEIFNELESSLTGPDAEQARQELRQLINSAQQTDITSPEFRQDLTNFMVETGGIEQARAERLVANAIQGYEQLQTQLRQLGTTVESTTEKAADSLAGISFWSFVALLLGALAAGWGGGTGAPHLLAARAADRPANPPER